MGITFKALANCLPYVTKNTKPILLRARHGVGKSECVYSYAKEIGLPVVERRASQMTEGDLVGMPKMDEASVSTKWLPPDWLKKSCDEAVVLFLDELDRATMEVRQGFFELADSRKIYGSTLHPETLIFAAINGGEHGAQYQVGEMDPAELDRWTVFDLEPSIEDWLNWAKNNVVSEIWDFINQNPNHLEHTSDFEPNKVYPSRRSWHRLSDTVEFELLEDSKGKTSAVLFNLVQAYVGLEAAVAFQDFLKFYKKRVTPSDIINKGAHALTKDFNINEHAALIENMKAKKWFSKKLSEKQLENIAEYIKVIPSEIGMKMWADMSEENLDNVLNMYEFITAHLVKVLKGE